ncbi:MAG: hypothetical protein JO297_09900 [Nitrososphaeraceae archaeon]|nr:hypothetical protein [Nitrososphaeraceae archaeon]
MVIINILLLSPPFGLFKKKNDIFEMKKDISTRQLHHATNSLTISEALELLQHIESERINTLASNLSPIKESVVKSLGSIERIVNNLERDDVKLEEVRFKSIVENSKRTVVSSLRREASSNLPMLESIHEVKKFKEKLGSIIDRIGEVSSSHSRVMNVFMKKYAGKLKGEFETLSSLLEKVKSVTSEFEEENSVIVECISLLNMLSQKIESAKAREEKIESTWRQVETLKHDRDQLKNQLISLENSNQFKKSYRNLEEIDATEKEVQEFHREILDLYSHVSRAFTRYSYGMTKDALARLRVLTEEPWKIFDADFSAYSSLLFEIQKAVNSGKIRLKDTEKIVYYMDIILNSLPEHQRRAKGINRKLHVLYENKDLVVAKKSIELKYEIGNSDNQLEELEILLDQLKQEVRENNSEREHMIGQIEGYLSQITRKKYSLKERITNPQNSQM